MGCCERRYRKLGKVVESLESEFLKKASLATQIVRKASHIETGDVKPHVVPIFQTTNFEYQDVDEALAIFRGERPGYIYTRYSNPTIDHFVRLVALLENAEDGVAMASGMAAITHSLLAFLQPGDEIIASSMIYGGTLSWMRDQLAALKIKAHFIDITDLNAVNKAINQNTRMIFTEVLGNPTLPIADVPALAELAESSRVLLMIDNTFSPPPIVQPLTLGADIVMHSATKYLGGHGDLVGGVVVSKRELVEKIRKSTIMYGGVFTPFNAWLAIRGMRTLALRVERQCSNADQIAAFLAQHPNVARVYYPGLPGHPQHQLAKKLLTANGAMLAFEVSGGMQGGRTVMSSVQICNFTVSLGEVDTLIIHPASTSHVGLSPENRQALGITDGLLRLSVGIENVDDLIADLDQALNKITKH